MGSLTTSLTGFVWNWLLNWPRFSRTKLLSPRVSNNGCRAVREGSTLCIDFEMYEGYDEELSPGILLHLNQVDRRYQRIGGWIRLIPEGRIIRVKDQPIQEALVFFTHQDDRRHELVFTRVTESAAVGYINVPSDSFLETAGQDWNSPSVAVVAND